MAVRFVAVYSPLFPLRRSAVPKEA